jgi:hypothetical protein
VATFQKMLSEESLNNRDAHINRGTWQGPIESLVDHFYLSEMVNSIAGKMMSHHFPGVAGIDDAYGLWESLSESLHRRRPVRASASWLWQPWSSLS